MLKLGQNHQNSLPKLIRKSVSFGEFLSDIAMFDVIKVDEGGQCYAVIAARSNARWWLIPLGNSRAAVAGFGMLQPISLWAKLAKLMALIITKYAPHYSFGIGILRLSDLPHLGEAFYGRIASMAFFTGTDGPHRKTTIQLMDNDGAILGYCKMSRKSHIRPYLRNEADMLSHVANLELRSANIPNVLEFRDDASITFLVTNSLKTEQSKIKKRLGREHLFFLHEISVKTADIGATQVFKALSDWTLEFQSRLSVDWVRRFQEGCAILRCQHTSIPVSLAHGDFTPWNTYLQSKRLYVFDWEYAHYGYPQGYDHLHFILATAGTDLAMAPKIVRYAIQHLAHTWFAGDHCMARNSALLSIMLHAAFYFERSADSGEVCPSFEDVDMRAALIDILLIDGENS